MPTENFTLLNLKRIHNSIRFWRNFLDVYTEEFGECCLSFSLRNSFDTTRKIFEDLVGVRCRLFPKQQITWGKRTMHCSWRQDAS